MKKMKIFLFGLFVLIAGSVYSQTPAKSPLDPIITKFNTGAGKVNSGDFKGAITDLEEVITMSNGVGASANDLKTKAQTQIPILNYQIATGLINQKKFEDAIVYLEKSIQLADSYGNNQPTKEKAVKLLPTLLFNVGNQKYKEKNPDAALTYYQSALKYSPNYAKVYLGLGSIYYDKNDEAKMLSNLQKAIEISKAANDLKTAEDAQKKIGAYYVNLGNIDLADVDKDNPDYSFAIKGFEKALTYDPKATDAYYTLALIYNKTLEFDKVIVNANKALESETVDVKIAAINYELGVAYTNTADYGKACESYKKALVGSIAEKAKAKMEKVPGCK
jgi:tetratricopeptide (TPR) repeat protein